MNQARGLIIDDEAPTRDVLRQLLNREGYETVEACDGREGVNAPKQPMDVLILDMLLPEQNGLEVIRALRGVDQAVPIIAISGYGHTGPVDVLVTVTRPLVFTRRLEVHDHMFPPCSMPSFSMTYSLSWRIWS